MPKIDDVEAAVADEGSAIQDLAAKFAKLTNSEIPLVIQNQSTVFLDSDVPALVSALRVQVQRDFFPAWGSCARLFQVPRGEVVPSGSWVLGIFDDSDQAGALGYHDITPEDLPLGKVFAKTAQANGDSVSVTASHELLEMLGDPGINLCAEVDGASGNPAGFYAYEVADAVEADQFGYTIGGILVSDFVLPTWFDPSVPAGTRLDHLGKVSKPLEILAGGYIGFLDLNNLATGWQMLQRKMDSVASRKSRAAVGSRRERRRVGRPRWTRSTFEVAARRVHQ